MHLLASLSFLMCHAKGSDGSMCVQSIMAICTINVGNSDYFPEAICYCH